MARSLNGNLRGRAARRTIDDWMDSEKQTGEIVRCGCGQPVENPWYGDIDCYECKRELQAEYDDIFPDMERAVLRLMDAVTVVYMEIPSPDPQTVPADWPWTYQDMRDELMNRYPESGLQ